jgi:hypothetical protein
MEDESMMTPELLMLIGTVIATGISIEFLRPVRRGSAF